LSPSIGRLEPGNVVELPTQPASTCGCADAGGLKGEANEWTSGKSQGTVEGIEAKGPGRTPENRGFAEAGCHIISYWVFMDTPRYKFFHIIRVAFEAMWDSKTVEITWTNKEGGDYLLVDICVMK
jgi:hypothetical protein